MREMIKVAMLKALLMVLAKIAVSAPIIIYLRFLLTYIIMIEIIIKPSKKADKKFDAIIDF